MRRFLTIGSLLILVIMTFATGAAFADTPDAEFDIYGVGYCDGLHIVTYPDGTFDGWQTGCSSGPLLGIKQGNLAQGRYYSIGFDDTADYGGYLFVLRLDFTWTIYANDGGGIYVINSGIWEYGTPPKGGEPMATGSSVAGGWVDQGGFQIGYDGYCDGQAFHMHADGTFDGFLTGCAYGPSLGTRGLTWTQGLTIGIVYDDTADFFGLYEVVRVDGTWMLYGNDGGGIYVINEGTWSYGPPGKGRSRALFQ
jgi:hypothetical protein